MSAALFREYQDTSIDRMDRAGLWLLVRVFKSEFRISEQSVQFFFAAFNPDDKIRKKAAMSCLPIANLASATQTNSQCKHSKIAAKARLPYRGEVY